MNQLLQVKQNLNIKKAPPAKTYVFNVQHYSLHDGPGIRTIAFFKGCPMRCRWCCNPESQLYAPEISYVENKCIGQSECGYCKKFCAEGISFKPKTQQDFSDKAVLDFAKCRYNLKCAEVCPSKAIKTEGKLYSAEQLVDIAERDSVFYEHGAGGLTISGGEPLTHPEFLVQVLQMAKQRRITTAIETCGYAPYSSLHEAAKYLDTVLFDIKSIDDIKHKKYTDCSNRRILDNFAQLCHDYPQLSKVVRTPVIPHFNDTAEDLRKILQFIQSMPHIESISYEALPYHRFGEGKYKALGRVYAMGDLQLSAAKKTMIEKINALIKADKNGGFAAAIRYLAADA